MAKKETKKSKIKEAAPLPPKDRVLKEGETPVPPKSEKVIAPAPPVEVAELTKKTPPDSIGEVSPEQLKQIEVVDPVVVEAVKPVEKAEPVPIDYQARIDDYIKGRRSMDNVVQRHRYGLHMSEKSGVIYVPVSIFK